MVRYMVIPDYSTSTGSCFTTCAQFQNLTPQQEHTAVLSHEVYEAITDPDPLNPAWQDFNYAAITCASGPEISDLCKIQSGGACLAKTTSFAVGGPLAAVYTAYTTYSDVSLACRGQCSNGGTACPTTSDPLGTYSCKLLQSDTSNCGSCGNACTPGWVCNNGTCMYQCNATTCPTGCCSGNACQAGEQLAYGCVSNGSACGTACPSYLNETCTNGSCTCTPNSCLWYQCGSVGNGCGGTLNCGSCTDGQWCLPGNVCGCPTGYQFCNPGCYLHCP